MIYEAALKTEKAPDVLARLLPEEAESPNSHPFCT
jgi:hypothetical protein